MKTLKQWQVVIAHGSDPVQIRHKYWQDGEWQYDTYAEGSLYGYSESNLRPLNKKERE